MKFQFDKVEALDGRVTKLNMQGVNQETIFAPIIEELMPFFDDEGSQDQSRAMQVFEKIPLEFTILHYANLVDHPSPKVSVYALEKIGVTRTRSNLPKVKALADSENKEIFRAAVRALLSIEGTAIFRFFYKRLPHFNDEKTRILLDTLCQFKRFRKWRILIPYLKSDSKTLSEATLMNLIEHFPVESWRYIKKYLMQVENKEMLIIVLKRGQFIQNYFFFERLMNYAYANDDVDIQSAARWELDKLPDRTLFKLAPRYLRRCKVETIPFVLGKLSERHEKRAGPIISKYLKHKDTTVQLAAVEALGELGEPKYRKNIEHLVLSEDPVAAYTATFAVVHLVDDLQTSEPLKTLLYSDDETVLILKQVVLQYCAEAVFFDFSDTSLLEHFLSTDNANIKMLTLEILLKRKLKTLNHAVYHLLLVEEDPDVRRPGLGILNDVLEGEFGAFFEYMKAHLDVVRWEILLDVLSKLKWRSDTAAPFFDWFVSLPEALLDAHQDQVFDVISAWSHAVLGHVTAYTRRHDVPTFFKYPCVKASLFFIDGFSLYEQERFMDDLLFGDDPVLVKDMLNAIVIRKLSWAIPRVIRRYVMERDEALNDILRSTIRSLVRVGT